MIFWCWVTARKFVHLATVFMRLYNLRHFCTLACWAPRPTLLLNCRLCACNFSSHSVAKTLVMKSINDTYECKQTTLYLLLGVICPKRRCTSAAKQRCPSSASAGAKPCWFSPEQTARLLLGLTPK